MSVASDSTWSRRLGVLREHLSSAGLDAFLVSHLTNLRYLTGLNASAGLAIVTGSRCVLVVDSRYVTAATELVASREDASVELQPAGDSIDGSAAQVLASMGVLRIGVEGAALTLNRFRRLVEALANEAIPEAHRGATPELVSTERVIERIRAVKDADELRTLHEAGRLLSRVAGELRTVALAGRTELDVAADIDARLRASEFERSAFETIVASGPNAALPHARPSRRVLQDGDGVVLDFGGVYDGYCVDLTRTIQLGGETAAFRRLFDAVEEAQRAARAAVRPGVLASAIDQAARNVLSGHGLAEAFVHATGHGLGLEVHEEPRIGKVAPGSAEVTLEPGMVFTIEPGVYVPGTGGVRIEDDVVVTADGCRLLTTAPVRL